MAEGGVRCEKDGDRASRVEVSLQCPHSRDDTDR